ncbi:CD1375 family protein [Huintestinicola sp.]
MVKIYIYCIKCGKLTIDDVPEKWREEVRKELAA